jgi:hypothetical protein
MSFFAPASASSEAYQVRAFLPLVASDGGPARRGRRMRQASSSRRPPTGMGFAAVEGQLPISPWSPRAGAVGSGESRWGRWERGGI